jgi:amylosucrase
MRQRRSGAGSTRPARGAKASPAGPATGTEASRARVEALARAALADLPARDVDLFVARLRRWWADLWEGLQAPYAARQGFDTDLDRLVVLLAERYRDRSDPLKRLDLDRSLRPGWFQDPSMIGYVAYVERFGGDLRGVEAHLDYLADLSVRYLHLMSVLQVRPGDNDGGYAVSDYLAVDPALGTMDDLENLCATLRARGISACIDLVLNHCAQEHEWAVRARAGEPEYEELFLVFPDRRMPSRYERTLPEVFPTFAPGNFTALDGGRWVWTTFNSFQWDLNWSNPRVFREMLDVLLRLANRGVEVFRLDAVAFMWKRLGTDCQNQPEVHDLLQALRACARIVAPAVVFKAEAIVSPDDLARYLGVGRHHGRVSDMAYHNSLMVQFWSALAARDTRLMTHVLAELPTKPATTTWATYIRCHDDIGWAITDDDAAAVGWNAAAHRAFLSDFYSGEYPGSFARGVVFQHNRATGDRRISGSLASLAGLERALDADDPVLVDLAIERILLGHALILGWDGIPLVYMGDEIGLRNDYRYVDDPDLAGDSRWVHRPWMDWDAAARRRDPRSIEGRIFTGLQHLIATRRSLPSLEGSAATEIVDLAHPPILTFIRRHPLGSVLAIHNLTDQPQRIEAVAIRSVAPELDYDRLAGARATPIDGSLVLAPYQVRWLTRRPDDRGDR